MSETAAHDHAQNGHANGAGLAPPAQPAPVPAVRDDEPLARFHAPRLPWHPAIEERYGIGKSEWKVLVETTFPGARTVDAIVMMLGYCKVRKLDIFKKPAHIVPVWDSRAGDDGNGGYVETVWPSISELRTTAFRTGQYAGCDPTEFGPLITKTFKGRVKVKGKWEDIEKTVTFPEWAQITVHRILGGVVRPYAGPKVYWLETYARQGASDVPNEMWTRRGHGQIEKCAEAGALRKAFPEELGNEYSAEEMEGQRLYHEMRDVTPGQNALATPKSSAGLRPPAPPSNLAPPRRPDAAATSSPASAVNAGDSSQSTGGPAASTGAPRSESAVGQEPTARRDGSAPERGDQPVEPEDGEQKLEMLQAALRQCETLDSMLDVWAAFEGHHKSSNGTVSGVSKVQWERAKGIYFDAQQRFHD